MDFSSKCMGKALEDTGPETVMMIIIILYISNIVFMAAVGRACLCLNVTASHLLMIDFPPQTYYVAKMN